MSWLTRRRPRVRPDPQPYGEPGYPEYWIEAMKRAYQLGEGRALPEIDRLAAITGMHPPVEWMDVSFPPWFGDLWISHLAPWNYPRGRNAMPY